MTDTARPHEPEPKEPEPEESELNEPENIDSAADSADSAEIAEGTADRSTSYATIAASSQFRELRQRYRGFAFPATAVFMAWYLLFVVCANWLPGFMNAQVFGHVNVALIFGLLQFLSTFLIAWMYARHANRKLDPIAEELNAQYRKEVGE